MDQTAIDWVYDACIVQLRDIYIYIDRLAYYDLVSSPPLAELFGWIGLARLGFTPCQV